MKTISLIIGFIFLSIFTDAQNISKRCKTCGKPISQCKYKGNHRPSIDQGSNSLSTKPKKEFSSKAIDLGLPSGTKWAEWNIGAKSPEQAGNYYAWGEIKSKSDYSWATYFDSKDGENFTTYFIYNKKKKLGSYSIIMKSTDVAHVNWGGKWHMPSGDQVLELIDKCRWKWTTLNGMKGFKIIGPNGNSIFLPAIGYKHRKTINHFGKECHYWSGDLLSTERRESFMKYYYKNDDSYLDWVVWDYATSIFASSDHDKEDGIIIFTQEIYRRRGMPIRAVQ